jgi:hypothetical protein
VPGKMKRSVQNRLENLKKQLIPEKHDKGFHCGL